MRRSRPRQSRPVLNGPLLSRIISKSETHVVPSDPPRSSRLDENWAFLREVYRFVPNRCARLGTNGFRTRLMLRPVTCVSGRDAAAMFYSGRFTKRGAMPTTAVALLQGQRSVQAFVGASHAHRKALFMDLLAERGLARAGAILAEEWARHFNAGRGTIVLQDAARRIPTATALSQVGSTEDAASIRRRYDETSAMIDQTGAIGSAWLRAFTLRRRSARLAFNGRNAQTIRSSERYDPRGRKHCGSDLSEQRAQSAPRRRSRH